MCQVFRCIFRTCRVLAFPSAEGVNETPGTEAYPSVNCLPEHSLLDLDTLPPLPEFFDALDTEECLRQLENLAQNFLQDNGDPEQESKQSRNVRIASIRKFTPYFENVFN